jgi:hypothetical protein
MHATRPAPLLSQYITVPSGPEFQAHDAVSLTLLTHTPLPATLLIATFWHSSGVFGRFDLAALVQPHLKFLFVLFVICQQK